MADEELTRKEVRAKIVAAYGGLLLPVAILFATLWFNHNNAQIAARQKCIDQSLEIVTKAYQGEAVSPTRAGEHREMLGMLATLGDLTVEACARANIEIPPFVSAALQRAQREAAGTPEGAVLAGVAQRARDQTGEETAAAVQALAPAAATGRVRLFIHINEEAQREAASRLERALEAASLGSAPIVVPGIELVPGSGDNSLRCLKRADCRRAPALLATVNGLLATPEVSVRDLSARFERAAGVAGGTYELWFGPGEIALAP